MSGAGQFPGIPKRPRSQVDDLKAGPAGSHEQNRVAVQGQSRRWRGKLPRPLSLATQLLLMRSVPAETMDCAVAKVRHQESVLTGEHGESARQPHILGGGLLKHYAVHERQLRLLCGALVLKTSGRHNARAAAHCRTHQALVHPKAPVSSRVQAVPNRHEHREHRLDGPLVAKAATASPAAAAADYLLGERDAAGQSREGVDVLRGDPHLLQRGEHGTVRNRADVAARREAGLEVPRRGKDYITALDPDSGDRWRLKGDRRMGELLAKAWQQTLVVRLSLWFYPCNHHAPLPRRDLHR